MARVVSILFMLIFFSCSKKSIPVITSRPNETVKQESVPGKIKPDTALGRIVFTSRCSRCHDLPQPSQYTAARWEGILSYMIPRARLDAEQAVHVTAFLKSNAAK